MKKKYVKDYMTTPAITCESTESIKSVIDILKKQNIGFIPVTKKGVIIGVLTDRDILLRGIGIYKLNSKVENIITNDIVFVNPDTSIVEAAKQMADKKVRRLVVLSDGKPVGVLTTKNLLSESSLFDYIKQTYDNSKTIKEYTIFENSNPHDSVDASDYPL